MRVKGIDGKTYTWSLASYVGNQNSNPSDLHLQVREFLKENFPALQILEEVAVPGDRIFLDFYIPVMKICVEANGVQHDKFVPFFHNNKMEFYKAQARDKRKAEFCRINGITLIYFYPDESETEWLEKLGIDNGK